MCQNVCKLFVFVLSLACGYKFPETFKRCHLNDPDFDSCLDTTIKNAIELIGNTGIPSLNLPSIDPLHIASIVIGEGTSSVNLVQKYNDVKVYGYSNLTVKNAHYDVEKKVIKFTSLHPEVRQEANYDFNGKILVFPIYGKGPSTVTMENWIFNHTINVEEKNKNNKKYFTVSSYTLEVNTTKAHFEFENLFNGNEQLSQTTLKVLNENWNLIIDDIKSGIALAYGDVFKLITNKFFDAVPVDEIFLS